MLQIPIQPVLMFLLAFIRVLVFLSFLPIFGELFTPVRIRVLLAGTTALVFTPLLAAHVSAFPSTLGQFVSFMAGEALLGMAFGLIGRILFASVQFAGQIMGEQIGFSMAGVMDPSQGIQIPVIAELLYIFALLLFFTANAHYLFFAALARSFEYAPPGVVTFSGDLAVFFTQKTARMFWIAVQMSLPVVALIFATNVAMGMVAKAVPQLNVFLESFPVRIIAGLFLVAGMMGLIAKMISSLFAESQSDLIRIISILGK